MVIWRIREAVCGDWERPLPKDVTVAPQNNAAVPSNRAHTNACPLQCAHRGTPMARIAASRPFSRSYDTFPAHTNKVYVPVI